MSISPKTEVQQQQRENIANIIAKKSLKQWQQIFALSDVCVEPVLTVTEAENSNLMQQRQMVIDVPLAGQMGKSHTSI